MKSLKKIFIAIALFGLLPSFAFASSYSCPDPYVTIDNIGRLLTIGWFVSGVIFYLLLYRIAEKVLKHKFAKFKGGVVQSLFYGFTAGLIAFMTTTFASHVVHIIVTDNEIFWAFVLMPFIAAILWFVFTYLAIPKSYLAYKELRLVYTTGWIELTIFAAALWFIFFFATAMVTVFAQISIDPSLFGDSFDGFSTCEIGRPGYGYGILVITTLVLIVDGILLRHYLSQKANKKEPNATQ